ncbi:Putative diacylglycerol O-acyltransferase [Mycobacterium innocens]|uniref:Diacylglycerol O-acyltransferase n=1 Tax=Mycobacterium innocens TaxID=2341083 RepID=A0A498QJX3_9MYCO|nr:MULTISPECIES: wax ester/triacylglycerol synthase family O-acyltransferase [Mycobacterium]VBA46689.1 Putative diacylglycerol O-acyltransferase [Mycobacterium innocens]
MKRLTGLDGVTLHGETPVMPTHVIAVLFCDPAAGGELTARAVLAQLAERTAATRGFRERLLTKPFGLGQPVWVEDPAFTVHDHLHHVRLPKPGTMRELAALVDQLHAQPLDRDRPLWDAWVVQGLTDGRLVVVMKFAHAMADGVGAVTSMLPQLMTTDHDAEFPAVPERAPVPMPGGASMVRDMIDEIAVNTAGGVRVAVKVAPGAVKSMVGTALGSVRQLLLGDGGQRPGAPQSDVNPSSPRTRLNAPITARRSVAFAAVAMEDLRAVTNAFDVTVNDVFLTAATSAVRRWLEAYDAVPDQPLRTLMPISTRAADDNASNSWSPTVVNLPVYLADPVQQLASIHTETTRIKKQRRAEPPVNLADVIDLIPPVVIGLVAGLYTGLKLSRFHPPVAHMITSNVAGPPGEIYCAGAHVVGIHAMAPLIEGANLNITAVSYGGTFNVGIVACPDNVDDVSSIARGIEAVVGELKKSAQEKTRQSLDLVRIRPPAHTIKSTTTTQFAPAKKRAHTKKRGSVTKWPA